ncbi:MAG TPA: FAD binding domain-containing protein [Candidatus Limnocylindrales bacterium]
MIPRFALARPRTLDEAFSAFAATDGDAAWLAGGTELLQVMKMGFAQFGTLVDLKGLDELRGIRRTADGLRIGAATTHREVERSADVAEAFPALASLERGVANVRVRSTGTLGGNLAFAEPHSDPATLLLAAGASVELAGPGGVRALSVSEFVLGPLFTAREADEILTAIVVPAAADGEGRAYGKLAFFERPAASVAVRLQVRDGRVAAATVTVGSITEVPEVVAAAGDALIGEPADASGLGPAIGRAIEAFGDLDVVEDLNGSADYKRHLAGVLLGSTVRDALAEATADA